MAGHRRAKAEKLGQPVRLRRQARAQGRRERLADRMAAAKTPVEQFAAAADFYRANLAAVPHELAAEAVTAVVADLIDQAERLHTANMRRDVA